MSAIQAGILLPSVIRVRRSKSWRLKKHFRRVIEANPNVGGRYSALIAFGLVPAILAGFDGDKLLSRSLKYSKYSHLKIDSAISHEDAGMQLGVVMGAAYSVGKDKIDHPGGYSNPNH